MCKCIYCNSTDLSKSDIISYALTGAKLVKKFVCREHNSFTNDHFEKIAISNLNFLRNSLGLTERGGNDIKFKANIIIDGFNIHHTTVSDRAAFYEDKNRLFEVEVDGQKFLIGNIEKLKQKKGVKAEDIKTLDTTDVIINTEFSLDSLLASDVMLKTIAKMSYEWYCYINNINEFEVDKFQDIVNYILMKEQDVDFVEIIVEGNFYMSIQEICSVGTHGIFEYTDIDGYKYVVFVFWGIIAYKVRIFNTNVPNSNIESLYSLHLYGIDGEKANTVFGIMGTATFSSTSALEAIANHHRFFVGKIEELIKTIILTLEKTRKLVDELKKVIVDYKVTSNFSKLVAYEDDERILIIRILLFLQDNIDKYDFEKNFNQNIKLLYSRGDTLSVHVDEHKEYLNELFVLHDNGTLLESVENAIVIFEEIYAKEKSI